MLKVKPVFTLSKLSGRFGSVMSQALTRHSADLKMPVDSQLLGHSSPCLRT